MECLRGDGDAVVVPNDFFQVLSQDRLGLLALQVGSDILTKMTEIQRRIIGNGVFVALQDLRKQRLQRFAGHVQFDAAQDSIHIKVGHPLPQLGGVQHSAEIHGVHIEATQPAEIRFQRTLVKPECLRQRIRIHAEQILQRKGTLAIVLRAKRLAGQHIDLGLGQLSLHNGAVLRLLHHMAHQGGGIADAGAQHGGHSPILRLNDADDGNILAVGHQ